MTRIAPTVGRVIHYYPTADDNGALPPPGQPLAGIVASVWNDRCINITYFDANGNAWSKTSVPLVQDDDVTRPGAGYCAWMPYQKGQAAKTEELQMKYDARGAADSALVSYHAGQGSLAAPRITLEDIEADIAAEHYFTAGQALAALGHPVSDGLDLLTFCVILLRNGTKIVGINYGAIDPAQHSEERGRKEARDHAIEQIWPLLGYELRSRLHQRATTCTCGLNEGCIRCGIGLSGE